MLLEAAAEKEEKTVDDYLAEQLDRIATDPTDAEIEVFFNANRARLSNRTLDQAKPLIANYLKGQRGRRRTARSCAR